MAMRGPMGSTKMDVRVAGVGGFMNVDELAHREAYRDWNEGGYKKAYGETQSGGCQASRTSQLPTVDFSWFGRKLTQLAARFAKIPPMFLSGK